MKKSIFLVLIGLLAMSCLIQAQDKKTKGYSVDSSSNVIVNPGVGGRMPQFPGGEKALMEFLRRNLKQQVDLRQKVGEVICRFIVNKDGSVSNIEVVHSLDPYSDAEAIKVLKLLPKFIPGKLNRKNVRVWYTIPILFDYK
jgi:TonB family protein